MTRQDELRAMVAAATPDWCLYGEPDVGLPTGLFAGVPGRTGFAPIEPLQGVDLTLAAQAPTLATDLATALDDLEKARAEVARLREALKPFSSVAGVLFSKNGEVGDIILDCGPARSDCLFFEDFLAARAALAPAQERAPTEYERKVAQMKEDFPNGI